MSDRYPSYSDLFRLSQDLQNCRFASPIEYPPESFEGYPECKYNIFAIVNNNELQFPFYRFWWFLFQHGVRIPKRGAPQEKWNRFLGHPVVVSLVARNLQEVYLFHDTVPFLFVQKEYVRAGLWTTELVHCEVYIEKTIAVPNDQALRLSKKLQHVMEVSDEATTLLGNLHSLVFGSLSDEKKIDSLKSLFIAADSKRTLLLPYLRQLNWESEYLPGHGEKFLCTSHAWKERCSERSESPTSGSGSGSSD